ncbi:type II secretion system major pseudopilin GspG [Sphingomonas sp. 7/4-4]|uniref:type II secretion system major pseudopilin GspG n=1 Tax=Sphingomonas sp. 7/4-4 TaxID=3018446 RepID=UPI0022F38D15|nr:type II secretion system major pseudopilin GspG [Sphingomonas sp. 7/4-4]WBY09404.1 type II secretion system major pseudopilin GspG [Sphingomonas sp. 7/4-4]
MKQFSDIALLRQNSKRRTTPNGESGFTLLEMMIVLVIIAVIAGLVTVNVMGRPDEARATTTKSNVTSINAALKMYRLDNGTYPTTEQGLKALVERPTAAPVPGSWAQGGYLSAPPLDAWQKPYEYQSDGMSFTIRSFGRDGKPGGEGVDADIDGKG